jgi:hypothetical protein
MRPGLGDLAVAPLIHDDAVDLQAPLPAHRPLFDEGDGVLFADQHVVRLDHLDSAAELGEYPSIVIEEGLLAYKVAGERAPARDMVNNILSSDLGGHFRVAALPSLHIAPHYLSIARSVHSLPPPR